MSHGEGFVEATRKARTRSLAGELWVFLRTTKKYWMIPIFIIAAIMVALALLSSSAAAPFIYSLF
jgi:Family of unknown function (DUF5989)